MTPEIRTATSADAGAVRLLWERCDLLRPWNDPLHDIALALGKDQATLLVMFEAGAALASVMAGFDGHRGWLYYLAVSPDRRREGLGRAIADAGIAWLRGHGALKVHVMVRDGNAGAEDFYTRLGMEPQDVTVFGRFLTEDR